MPGHRLAPLIAEAMEEPLFADRWGDDSDGSFRPFAVAALQLSDARRVSDANRRSLYRNLCTGKRVEVLGEIVRRPLAPRVIKLVGRADWKNFSRSDWDLFLAIAIGEGVDSALGHVSLITSTLVRQFSSIPLELRLPAILRVACRIEVPAKRWDQLYLFLERADTSLRADLLRMAGSVDSNGAFWDFYVRCEGRHWRPFNIPETFFSSTLLRPLKTPQEMEAEAFRMRNCLANRVSRVRSGCRIYFRLSDEAPVNAELVRVGKSWVPGEILSPSNAAAPAAIAQQVRTELQRLADSISVAEESLECVHEDDYVEKLREAARLTFGAKSIAELNGPLRSIQGKSRSWSNGAFAIFELDRGGYVQFMSSPDGKEYLCEISSHKYEKWVNEFLTAPAVDLIEKAGFVWPNSEANFLRWFNISSEEDIQAMAEVALAILSGIFGHRPGRRVVVKTHIPD